MYVDVKKEKERGKAKDRQTKRKGEMVFTPFMLIDHTNIFMKQTHIYIPHTLSPANSFTVTQFQTNTRWHVYYS